MPIAIWTAGEQLKCPALLGVEKTFSRGRRHPELLALQPIISVPDRGGFGAGGYARMARELWQSTVTHMNSVKIVAASLRVLLSQVKEGFR